MNQILELLYIITESVPFPILDILDYDTLLLILHLGRNHIINTTDIQFSGCFLLITGCINTIQDYDRLLNLSYLDDIVGSQIGTDTVPFKAMPRRLPLQINLYRCSSLRNLSMVRNCG